MGAKRFGFLLFVWVALYSGTAGACKYDEESSTFYGAGAPMKLYFGVHGIPSSVNTFAEVLYNDKVEPGDKKKALETMIGHHSHSLANMTEQKDKILKELKKNPSSLRWLAIEGSGKSISANMNGALLGLVELMDYRKKRLMRAGATEEQATQALLITSDPAQAAVYQAIKDKVITPSQLRSNRSPSAIGVDNARSEKVDELEKRSHKNFDEIISEINSIRHDDFSQSPLKVGSFLDSKKLAEAIADTKKRMQEKMNEIAWPGADPNKIAESSRQLEVLRKSKKIIEERIQINDEKKHEEEQEMIARDKDMASNLLKQAQSKNGQGAGFFGATHKAGILENLISQCQAASASQKPAPPQQKRGRR